MKKSIINRLEKLHERFLELRSLLSDVDVINNNEAFRSYSQEYSHLEPIIQSYEQYCVLTKEVDETKQLATSSEDDIRALASETLEEIKPQLVSVEKELQLLLLPRDPDDCHNVFLEVRAGTGGNEAALFAGDLLRMYMRYAEQKAWKVEVLSESIAEMGGYKEVITRISGHEVYAYLKFESGVHRVQRVPTTESQGRIHTSACTVAILPEPGEQEEIGIRKEDLRIDTYRSSGAGGQHVNTTDSAVRVTHLPTGVAVECQDERSQHKNKAKALALLSARLKKQQQEDQQQVFADQRKNLVGSGDRSERIRTYNYPQGRVTDHRINLTLYKLPEVMEGDIDTIILPLIRQHQTDMLALMGEEA